MDAQLRLRLQIEIRHLARRLNKTTLFVTHDLDEAVALADRCAIFTPRPGTITRIVDIPLPADRNPLRLRHNKNYSLPKVALAPLFILWFGIGIDMKIALIATIVFFLVFLNTYAGVREVSRELTAILRLMGARARHLLTKVVIPSAITWVFAGLRISAPYALVGAVVGELVASNRGLGYLLVHAAGKFDTAGVFAALGAIVVLASLLNAAVGYGAKRAMPWRDVEGHHEITI